MHRLSSIGALITHTSGGTSPEGFDAEWRMIQVLTVEGDHVNRCELFDEADLDIALARFDELSAQTRCLENAASQADKRFLTRFAAGDWDAMAELLADNYSLDDRRRVVGAGVRQGRDAQVVDMRAIAEVWITNVTSTVIAIRGERLVLMRVRHSEQRSTPRGVPHGDASRRRDQRRRADRRGRFVRPRRRRCCLRRVGASVPRLRSDRTLTHVVDHRGGLRRASIGTNSQRLPRTG